MWIFAWLFASLFIAFVFGVDRKIGFWHSFFVCLFLSPMIGLVIILVSEDKKKAADRERMIELQEENNWLLKERQKESH